MRNEEDHREILNSLFTYHKYRSEGERNPKFDDVSRRVLDLKDETNSKHAAAVRYFGAALGKFYKGYRVAGEEVLGAIVPSSTQGVISPGLIGVLAFLKEHGVIAPDKNPLKRIKTIAKLARGGCRDVSVHTDSISVDKRLIKKYGKVLLLDDVMTTGNSLIACRNLLYSAGAHFVLTVALCKTHVDAENE